MKFKVDAQDLSFGLKACRGIASGSASEPLRAFVWIKQCKDTGKLLLGVTDHFTTLTVLVDAEFEEDGEAAVSCIGFHKLVSMLKGDLEISQSNWLDIKHKKDSFSLAMITDQPFKTPGVPDSWVAYDKLGEALEYVVGCASTDDIQRPQLCGVLFDQTDDSLLLAASDSQRLGSVRLDLPGYPERKTIHRNGAKEMARLVDGACEIGSLKRHTVVRWNDSYLWISNLVVDFPDISGILPTPTACFLKGIDKDDLLNALKKIEILGSYPIVFDIKEDSVVCCTKENDSGKGATVLNCTVDWSESPIEEKTFTVAYGIHNLRSVVNHCPKTLDFRISGMYTGAVIEFDNVSYMIMPRRF